ncbi:aminotransferase class V-fold PLP-dependent enzyme [Rhizobium sp. LC145]|uniref:pyridoxal-phosphate-dependent aminotransferase family protein n=1 Tax=Rhizobium sp. LC145 TaxID=1120688 RepID=UPI00062A5081|nr:aminotransferase class V-fold PLP-dependent enzyme [Rhizobium sp. LC145]KKX31525.1 aspartate aminotransferase [Rhizobium sp. LC145]TKT66760.1 alanine--glyoxylate aminotransferase family protein [Rhizobiaceae bacterium LC148]
MASDLWNLLNDLPAFSADRYASIADRIARLLGTGSDVVLIQAEAIVALEAVAASLARPGLRAANIVTSPYGGWFGGWLRRGEASVIDIMAEPAKPIEASTVAAALETNPDIRVLSLVHAESASGILNPLEDILSLARQRGILTVVDAVASIGGHPLDVDALGIDIAVIGPQKSLAGPAGLSAVSVSRKAWEFVARNGAPRNSVLSLLDQRDWIEEGRGALPGTPSSMEFFALEAALDRIEAEGLENVLARHAQAAAASRAGLLALGAEPWAAAGRGSHLVTTVKLPESADMDGLLKAADGFGAALTAGVGPGAGRLVRLNHTGRRARLEIVLANVLAYGMALRAQGLPADIAAASDAVTGFYGG